MQKQTKMSDYMHKKIKKDTKPKAEKAARQKHNSSRQNSVQTERLDESPQVVLQVYGKMQSRSVLVCPAFVLITPPSLISYKDILYKLKRIQKNYGKEDALTFIEANIRFLQNMQDDDFWCFTLPSLFEILIANIDKIDSCLRFLLPNTALVIDLSRRTVLLLLICMFLGIMPKQPHEDCVTFGQLMLDRENQFHPAKAKVRRQKLKCIINYFKMVVGNQHILDEKIRIQRTNHTDSQYMNHSNYDRYIPMRGVTFKNLTDSTIEDHCGKAVMVDFANKKIGGGVLKNGCVQEQVLFSIFPEAIVTKLLCHEMQDKQAIIIYGARRFSKYKGYSDTFEFDSPSQLVSSKIAQKSAIVAIDAFDFSKNNNQQFQYSKRGIRRQINKAFTGFQGVSLEIQDDVSICTGKWGCGAFKGDQDLKFVIQWMACSESSRQMIYISDSAQKMKEYDLLVRQLSEHYTLDVLSILDEYFKARNIVDGKMNLLQYMKNYI